MDGVYPETTFYDVANPMKKNLQDLIPPLYIQKRKKQIKDPSFQVGHTIHRHRWTQIKLRKSHTYVPAIVFL